MKTFKWIATLLMVIGSINWGLVGVFNFNVVDAIFGMGSVVSTIIYILVGISGLWGISFLFGGEKKSAMMPQA
ncbi:DUF378 domain-containing protein [Patescibacteria group bacterium]|nr:DUF378 domain-containing protein [Patescibacteria group bacterium]